MIIKQFQDIKSWQKSKELTIHIYRDTEKLTDFGYKDQMRRASVSIMNNIAEGFERETKKELIRYLYISKGSCAELRSMIILGKELSYFTDDQYNKYFEETLKISQLLAGFIRSLK